MNTSERSGLLRETDHIEEHGGDPGGGGASRERRSDEPAPPRDSVGPHIPDKGAKAPFVGGAGI